MKRWLAGQRFISFCAANDDPERKIRNTIHAWRASTGIFGAAIAFLPLLPHGSFGL
jgi:hypothetical protein